MSASYKHRGTIYQLTSAHPIADFYPWPTEYELDAIAADIHKRGQDAAIVLLADGRILDGRTRELCCLIAGVQPRYETRDIDEHEIASFIRSRNDHRRHMTVSQRAAVAAAFATLKQGERKNETGRVAGLTQAEAAKAFDVGERSVRAAAGVKEHAPELFEAVKEGKLSVSTAAKASVLPPRVRAEIAASAEPRKAAERAVRERRKSPAAVIQVQAKRETVPPQRGYTAEQADEILELIADVKRALRAAEEGWGRITTLVQASAVSGSPNLCIEDAFQCVESVRKHVESSSR